MRLHYKIRENESVQYCDMSLYPYICKYFKFPIGHPIIHVGDACADKEASKDERLDEMNDRAAKEPLSSCPPFSIQDFIPPVPIVFRNLTRLANVSISTMLKGVWKARG